MIFVNGSDVIYSILELRLLVLQ